MKSYVRKCLEFYASFEGQQNSFKIMQILDPWIKKNYSKNMLSR